MSTTFSLILLLEIVNYVTMSLLELIEFLICFRGDCGMFVLKYIELLSTEIPLATCTSQNMPFFRLKLAAEILRGDAYMP